jgi:putative RNA 2'-phosphotransferase
MAMSADTATATQVCRCTALEPLILHIRAGEAHGKGVRFYRGNDLVWLADAVAPELIE